MGASVVSTEIVEVAAARQECVQPLQKISVATESRIRGKLASTVGGLASLVRIPL